MILAAYRPNRSNYQIYKSRWSLTKCLYLACRFGLLLCWPIVMYAFSFDHDEESCRPFLVIVSVLFMLFVRPTLFFLLTNSQLTHCPPTVYHWLAVLPSMSICPPCICNHRRKTLVIVHLSTLPLCLPLRPRLVFSEPNDTLERSLSNIRQNRVFQSFPSWI